MCVCVCVSQFMQGGGAAACQYIVGHLHSQPWQGSHDHYEVIKGTSTSRTLESIATSCSSIVQQFL